MNLPAFELQQWFLFAATFVFAVTGAIVAIRRNYDVIGVFFLALVTGLGGALLRDGLFLQNGPALMLRDWRYLPTVMVACGFGWWFGHWHDRFNLVFSLLDALGLAAYGVIGSQLSIHAGLSAPAAVLVGVVNAAGGGILRDILVREEPIIFRAGQFYALASTAGCVLFVTLVRKFGISAPAAGTVSLVSTFVLRVLAIHYNWKTSPLRLEDAASGRRG
jgi:uncharacterized membrane protein YeiH